MNLFYQYGIYNDNSFNEFIFIKKIIYNDYLFNKLILLNTEYKTMILLKN